MSSLKRKAQLVENDPCSPWIQTFTGRQFFPFVPRKEDVCIEDIAHHLANRCRFSGACDPFYSVAQHSVMVAEWAMSMVDPVDIQFAGKPEEFGRKNVGKMALMHDSAEAYLGDVVSPYKHDVFFQVEGEVRLFADVERRLLITIFAALSIPWDSWIWSWVDQIDRRMLITEAKQLMASAPVDWTTACDPFPDLEIRPDDPCAAEAKFHSCWESLQ